MQINIAGHYIWEGLRWLKDEVLSSARLSLGGVTGGSLSLLGLLGNKEIDFWGNL